MYGWQACVYNKKYYDFFVDGVATIAIYDYASVVATNTIIPRDVTVYLPS